MRPHSGVPKKVREATLRRQRAKERRFNEPLRVFLERKHPAVLSEFQQLYDWLDQRNPDRGNLTLMNTDDFKQWQINNPLPSQDFTAPPVPIRLSLPAPIQPSPVQSEQILVPHLEIPLLSTQISQRSPLVQPQLEISPSQNDEDILGLAYREVFEPVSRVSVEPSLEEVDIPQAILNEIMEDDFLRDLLNSVPEELPELRDLMDEVDEGIELNHMEEVIEDIEPFDFAECELF